MSFRQIDINGNMIGLNDIDESFEPVKSAGISDEAEIKNRLYEAISKNNYIPPKLKNDYIQAIYEEYLVFAGKLAARKTKRAFPEIRVYGAGCPVCEDLDDRIMKILERKKLHADYRYVFDPKEIKANEIKDFPTITIDGKVAHKGMVENEKELEKIVMSAFAKPEPR